MYEKLYRELLARYNKLETENIILRQRLGLTQECDISKSVSEVSSVNKNSSPKDKIELFLSLFRGRSDVFAKRWQNASSAKSGYQPVCVNEWVEGLCDKRKYKCANCPNRLLKPLTNEDVYKHHEGKDNLGRDVIGIYPLLLDETCYFLCVDFDDGSFYAKKSHYRHYKSIVDGC